jgi:N-acetylneuraminic acid mutarotase
MFTSLQVMRLRVLLVAGLIAVISLTILQAANAQSASVFTTIDVSGAGTGTLQGTAVTAIDAVGDVAGFYEDANSVVHAFVLPARGAIISFSAPDAATAKNSGVGTVPIGFDTAGDIVGFYKDADSGDHGFIRAASTGAITEFNATGAGTDKGQGTVPLCINGAGEIAGVFIDANNLTHGFVRSAGGTITTFDAATITGTSGKSNQGIYFVSINASGVVAGTYIDANSLAHGFIRSATGAITTFSAPGAGAGVDQGTSALAIDTAGDVTGIYIDSNNAIHGFLRSAGGAISTIDAPGAGTATYQGTYPDAFDAAGDISGSFTDANNGVHGFVRPANGAISTYDAPGSSAAEALLTGASMKLNSKLGQFGKSYSSLIKPNSSTSLLGKTRNVLAKVGAVNAAGAGLLNGNGPNPSGTASYGNLILNAVNASGEIIGFFTDGDYVFHTYLRAANGTITAFDAPNAGTASEQGTGSLAINASGTIVGGYIDTNSVIHGFVYSPALTATTTALQSGSNTSTYGGPITLTATVSSAAGAPPDGETVYFMSGAATLGSQTLSGGTAQLTMTDAPAGTDSITAVYPGDLNFSGSTSTPVSQTVSKATSSTTLTASPNPSSFQQLVTLTATVSGQLGGIATGSVAFKDGTATLGTVPLSGASAVFTYTLLPQGTDSITAVYSGDSNFTASTSNTVSQVVGAEVLGGWTWMGGSNTIPGNYALPGLYGTLGTFAAGNMPGSHAGAGTWTGSNGNFWFFGGQGYDSNGNSGSLNDLWEFNPSTNQWAWMGGSSQGGCASGYCGAPGVYGTLGTPAAGNIPPGRNGGVSWTDQSGNFWLFAGSTYDAGGNYYDLNDLWKFNPSTNQWAWMGGSSSLGGECAEPFGSYSVCGPSGNWGKLGTAATGNTPGSREEPTGWTDSSGNLWLLGGLGFDSVGNYGYLNDLWEFIPSTNQWIWIAGSSTVPDNSGGSGQPGVYGTLGTPAAGNLPGARECAVSQSGSNNLPWLFGGQGYDSQGNWGSLNDLWYFNPSTKQWTWRSGSSTVGSNYGQSGVYGTLGKPAAANVPGGRNCVMGWTGSGSQIWLFGGNGYDLQGYTGFLNDLWEFNPSAHEWTWMGGGSTLPSNSGIAGLPGVYGTLGTPAAANIPGSRYFAQNWTDSSGNLWLFGGFGFDAAGNDYYLNDLWKYQPLAVPAVTVSPSASTITTAQALSVKVTVSGGGITPTGSVTLIASGFNSGARTLSGGSATIAIPAGSLVAGNDTLTANYAPDSSSSSAYMGAAGAATVYVTGIAAQSITFPTITASQYALTKLPLVATATSGLAVTFTSTTPTICTVSGSTASLLTVGTCILHAAQAGNSNYSAAPTVSQGFYVHPAQQTITFPTIAGAWYALQQITLSATASSGLAVSFATTTPTVCTVSGNTASLLIGGSCILQATQAGNAFYGAATPVTQVVAAHLAHQSITVTPVTGTKYALSQLALSASSNSGLPVTLSSVTPTVCTLSGNTASFLIAGTCDIHATQAGNATYAAAPLLAVGIDVHPILQTITFTTVPSPEYPLTKVTLSATSTSGLTVSFASITPTVCTVSGKTASLLTAGNCYLHAVQTGNPDYAAAPIVTQLVVVTPLSQTITWPAITATQYAASTLPLAATASSGLAVAFASTTPTVCTVAGTTASLLTTGTCILKATQTGNAIYAAAPVLQQSLVVHLAAQTITFPTIGTQTAGANVTLAATASSGLTVAFSSTTTSVCTVSGTTATMLTAGTCTIHATQAGNTTYSAAPLVSQSITVKAAS